MINEVVEMWVRGWTVSRATAAPVAVPGGYRVDVGLPGHLTRYVLPRFEPAAVSRLAARDAAPGTWLKICADPREVAGALPPNWQVQDPEYLMTVPLRPGEVDVPGGYILSLDETADVIIAEVRDDAGRQAAAGRMARTGAYTVADQVRTDPAHRRRGLGSLVMKALGAHAAATGARTGVLVATAEGCALYRTLGWNLLSPVTAAVARHP
ncbi:GNAT family N-acetyltransferase [Spirillospora sp. NPDC127200]